MNLTKSKVVLKKINALHDNIELSNSMSKIEKDLFLDYIKELYEIVTDTEYEGQKKVKKAKKIEKKNISKNVVPPIEPDEIEQVAPEENHTEALPRDIEDNEPMEETKVAPSNGVKAPSPVSVKPKEKPVDPEIEGLFDPEIIERTAYRFSQTPIEDIGKAMGINERMLTINLLFNKDQQEFDYITKKLNYFDSYDDAVHYLKTEVAPKHNWTASKKRGQAQEFIKLVRRKHSA